MTFINSVMQKLDDWSKQHNIEMDEDCYVRELKSNLFQQLKEETRDEFIEADGNELSGKMLALHSSSALAINFFEPMRTAPSNTAKLFGSNSHMDSFKFESKHRVITTAANLDFEFYGKHYSIAVEAKFLEPYRKRPSFIFSPAYFSSKNSGIWDNLRICRNLAESNPGYQYLDAAQLVKHIVGLSRTYGTQKKFTLVYLWYGEKDFSECRTHQNEIEDFTEKINPEISFCAYTYQDMFKKIQETNICTPKHVRYLGERYFQ